MTAWRYTDKELKQILHRNNDPDNEEQSVLNTVKELIPHLKKTPCYNNLDEIIYIYLQNAKTFHTFNQALNAIYDYANENKIWLGFMPLD
jgi:hypothetical protein